MIPLLVNLRIHTPQRRFALMGIPVFLIWILLLPFIILLLPFACIACWSQRMSAFGVLTGAWRVFAALRGTHVEFAEGHQSVFLQII